MVIPFSFIKSGVSTPIVVFSNGQSNDRGEGNSAPGYTGDITGVNVWNGSAFVTLNWSVSNNNQLGQPQGTFGPELSMCKELHDTTGRPVYLIKYSIGSSGLASVAQGGSVGNWNPAEVGDYFDAMITEMLQAIAALPAVYEILGFFHYQGEADGVSATIADLYHTNLTAFINAIRSELSLPTLKFYLTRILNIVDTGVLQSCTVRLAQTKYAHDNRPNAYLLTVDDLGIAADQVHLTSAGYLSLGLRRASTLNTNPDDVTVLLSDDFPGTTIATKNWVVTGTGISQNNKIIFTNNHAGTIAFASGRLLTSRYVIPNNIGDLFGRVRMLWTDPVVTNQSSGGFLFFIDVNNYVGIMTDAGVAGGNAIRIRKRQAGVNTDTATSAVNGDEFKIRYNTSTGSYQIWRWNGSSWASMGTGTGATGRGRYVFTTNDSAAFTGGDQYEFHEFDVSVADFITRRPIL